MKNSLYWKGLGFFCLAFLFSLGLGDYHLNLFSALGDLFSGRQTPAAVILWEIRLPRAVLACLAGAVLGLSGAAMQGLLRNPLAEPGILGVSGGAVCGAVFVLFMGWSAGFALALPLGGLAGALMSVILIWLLSLRFQSALALILTGFSLNALFFALSSLLLSLVKNPFAVYEIVFWQMGSLADRGWQEIILLLPFVLLGGALLLWDRKALNALSLGTEAAHSLGTNVRQVTWRLIAGTACAVGAMVSICGAISFVGLIVPHIARPWVKNEPGKLLPASAWGGALFVLGADILARLWPWGSELKLGVICSLLGVPFLIRLIFKNRRQIA